MLCIAVIKQKERQDDAQGKLLFNKTAQTEDNTLKLKLDLKNGIYFVNLSNEKGERTTKKLVICK